MIQKHFPSLFFLSQKSSYSVSPKNFRAPLLESSLQLPQSGSGRRKRGDRGIMNAEQV